MSLVEREYRIRMDAMSVGEKMARAGAMFPWAREMIARQIRSKDPTISAERLRWEVALRQHGAEPQALIDTLERVPA